MRVARYITGDEELAEMAAQEAWVGICRNWRRLNDPDKFSPWAFGILRRKCFDVARQAIRRSVRTAPLDGAPDPGVPARGEMQIELSQAFDMLSPAHRTVAILYFGEELTLAEIAAVLDRPLGTVQSRIFHARKHLKAALSGEEI
jgi:RNA polymerase sigma-70 factor (ECF subfamily)